ncbi:MAG: HIT family protein [Tannerellaceae bacterium]|jgi:histidine triad (HIT) family protein|nr:HIT family protein [Tannerellaceae bacterium]
MATLFSRIITGEIPSHKIAEDEEFFAFLDINPVATGHTLVVPKVETDYIFDLDDGVLGRMMAFAKRVAQAQKAVIPCRRIGLAVIGLEVPHAHIHLIPVTAERDMHFGKGKQAPSQEELAETADSIRAAYRKGTIH